jgi:acetyltransferase-like isoleucine patch superfamily enzyme
MMRKGRGMIVDSVATQTIERVPFEVPLETGGLRSWVRRLGRWLLVTPSPDSFEVATRSGFLRMGVHSYGRPRVHLYPGDTSRVEIGNFCSIASDVELIPGGQHRLNWVSTFPFRAMFLLPGRFNDGHPAAKGDITIGNDVWIGRGAKILSGVSIGDGAVVGAYAVVADDVRPYAIVAGNPARELRRRFSDEQIDSLLTIAWWKWSEEKILEHVEWLNNFVVTEFIAEFGRSHTSVPTEEHRSEAVS